MSINITLYEFLGYGSATLGRILPVYGAARLMIDASIGERKQIQYNIMNNRPATEGVYNPLLGFIQQ